MHTLLDRLLTQVSDQHRQGIGRTLRRRLPQILGGLLVLLVGGREALAGPRESTGTLEQRVQHAAQVSGLARVHLEHLLGQKDRKALAACEDCAGLPSELPESPLVSIDGSGAVRLVASEAPPLDRAALAALLPFQVTPEIAAFADRNTRGSISAFQRVNGLIQAIYTIGRIDSQYVASRTATAQETLVTLRGNCFSFTNLLVASARAAGLEAYFMDASRSNSKLKFDGERVVHAGHIVAGISTNLGIITVDFYSVKRSTDTFWYQRMTDDEAVSMYINNLGYDAMRLKQDPVPYFRTAIALSPQLESPWNNLATVLKGAGRLEEARAILMAGVAHRPSSFAPYYNLGMMYLQEEKYAEAEAMFHKAMVRRFDNPFLFYQLGVVYLKRGHPRWAELALARAVRLDESNQMAKSKLDRLRSAH